MKLKPFDAADYLDCEEGIEAYLEDARTFGDDALSDAQEVVARARARMARTRPVAAGATASDDSR